jgi:ABC-type transporter Mla MlaB component
MAMTSERPPMQLSPPASEPEPRDRCRFGRDFDRGTIPCPAFQRAQFIAATSYGKPLGTHVACAHLAVGELATNQFYPRCSLGSENEKMRWVARMGPGRIEVLRALNAEFEASYAGSLRELIAAKADALADPPDNQSGRAALTVLVRTFITDFSEFVNRRADRIAEIGISPSELIDRATNALLEWQQSRRLDLPALDDQSMLRPDGPPAARDEHLVVAAGLVIGRTTTPASLRLIGSIDHANLDVLERTIDEATAAGAAVTVDLSAVTFSSVAGLRILIDRAETNAITLLDMPAQLVRALAAAGLVPPPGVDETGSGLEMAQ